MNADDGPTDNCDDVSFAPYRIQVRWMLKRAWDIRNGNDELQQMSVLLDDGHSPDIDAIVATVRPVVGASPQQKDEFLQTLAAQHGASDAHIAGQYLAVLELPQMPPLPSSTYAWDLARIAMLARATVKAGWLAPEQVLPIMEVLAAPARAAERPAEPVGPTALVAN